MKNRALLLVLMMLTAVLVDHRSRACSCVGPHLVFLSPLNADAAPLNVHVRLEAPTGRPSQFVLRVLNGANVATQTRTIAGTLVTLTDLTPSAALPALTQFEVATVDPTAHPPTTVVGTFKTGSASDTTAPRLDSLGRQRTHLNTRFGGGDCSIQGPWITLTGVVAHDERPDAQLAYGVWQADRTGRLDTQRAPDALVFPSNNVVAIGQTSRCDTNAFTFNGSAVSLAVAAIDDAGNTSRPITLRADLTQNTP